MIEHEASTERLAADGNGLLDAPQVPLANERSGVLRRFPLQMAALLAYATSPTWYQVALYRELGRRLGSDFHAVFLHGGHADGLTEESWGGACIANDTGLLTGYPHTVLFRRPGLSTAEAAKLRPLGLSETIRQLRPRSVLLNSHGRSVGIRQAIATAKLVGARLLLRSTPYDIREYGLLGDLSRSIYLRSCYSLFDAFCAVGSLPRLHFIRYSGRPGAVFMSPYCIDEFFLAPRASAQEKSQARRQFRAELGIGADDRVFVTVSRLVAVKRLDLTLAAFSASLQEREASLVIVGDGDQRHVVEAWQKKLGGRLFWLGAQEREGVARALAGSDAMLLGSDSETWGVVVNEGLTFHLPVVVSDNVAAAVDLIHDGSTGFRFRTGDVQDYIRAIGDLHGLLDVGPSPAAFAQVLSSFTPARAADGVLRAHEASCKAPLRRPWI